jgi:hypothetical protein
MRTKTVVMVLGMMGAVMTVLSQGSTSADPVRQRKLRHIVLYKFKDDLPPARIQEVVEAFAELPKKIAAVAGFEHGTNVSPEGKSEGFTHVFVVTFHDEKGLDEYLVHPAHLEYVNLVKDRREKVVVVDYWAEE